ncbi:DUF418 domain-containing protein [Streptomyces sp. NPDC091377]|uniref:DUF418 domain-containing protein n=1 Tax=Streptomyces sp. NPDC091377 TaxID=3365995 RepID=UPI0038008E58
MSRTDGARDPRRASGRGRSYATSGVRAPRRTGDEADDPGRIPALDVLRGFALFGILVVNALMTAGPYSAFGGGPDASDLDRAVSWLVTALVAAKFYLLFSFLFGYGFVLQERSARREGAAFAPRHLRRTLALFTLGAAHAVLLYPGDILTTYAVLALPLYGLRRLAPRTALRIAAGLLLALFALLLLEGLLTVALTEPRTVAEYVPTVADTVAAHRGDAADVLGAHLSELPDAIAAHVLYAPDFFAAFLAGLAAAKVRLLERRGRDRAWLRRTALRWLPLGLLGGVFTAVCAGGPLDHRWYDVGQAASVLTAPALTASYACALLLLLDRFRTPAAWLAASGRMALTHYLTQSLVLALVFTGYGAGLYDRVGAALVLAGCVVLYGAQLALGVRLMGRRRYAPAELLLRTVTLARRPAGRPADPSTAGPPASDAVPPAR